jgi:hypothetical protein
MSQELANSQNIAKRLPNQKHGPKFKKPKSKKVYGKKKNGGGGLGYSSEDKVTGHGKDKEVLNGEVVDRQPVGGLPGPEPEIIDAEWHVIPQRAIGAPAKGIAAPKAPAAPKTRDTRPPAWKQPALPGMTHTRQFKGPSGGEA